VADFIFDFWESQARRFEDNPEASWGDKFALSLESIEISKQISLAGNSILDVGCANGFAIFDQARKFNEKKFTGVDFSPEMILNANRSLANLDSSLSERCSFKVMDARNLEFEDETFDCVYTTRTLINLPNWEEQKRAIAECMRVTKKSGVTVFSEGFFEPLVLLNAMRALLGLKPLVEHDFNRYLKLEKVKSFLELSKLEYKEINFSSLYYFGTRIVRELATSDNAFTSEFNERFYRIEKEFDGGNLGIQKVIVVYK
jgi:ubiquinone/menaquinone biosynthesis C-methylase UbiE